MNEQPQKELVELERLYVKLDKHCDMLVRIHSNLTASTIRLASSYRDSTERPGDNINSKEPQDYCEKLSRLIDILLSMSESISMEVNVIAKVI